MFAVNSQEAFVIAVEAAKGDYRNGKFEPVIIDSVPLRTGRVTGIIIGGLGPDATAPSLYRAWSNSDFAGGIYQHPTRPCWYVSAAFLDSFKSLALYRLIQDYFIGVIDTDNPEAVLRAMWHITA